MGASIIPAAFISWGGVGGGGGGGGGGGAWLSERRSYSDLNGKAFLKS